MSLNLSKGENISLQKGLKNVCVGLGWDVRSSDGAPFDLDAFAFMLKADGKCDEKGVVYFKNLKSPCGSVVHMGDNLTGEGDGDDEQIKIDLEAVPADIQKIALAVSIYQAKERGQNFGLVQNAFIRLVNEADQSEIARFDLSEDAGGKLSVILGELYRHEGDWKFRALGEATAKDMEELVNQYVS